MLFHRHHHSSSSSILTTLVSLLLVVTHGFVVVSPPTRDTRLWQAHHDDFMVALRQRREALLDTERQLADQWRSSDCFSQTAMVLPDWVRRIDVDDNDWMVCGSASGSIYVGFKGEMVASAKMVRNELKGIKETLRLLYGKFDGGGTIDVAISNLQVCSANRCGGVMLHRVDVEGERLVAQGSVPCIDNVLVTCLQLEEDYLWVGTADGRVMAFNREELALATKPDIEYKFGSTVLSLDVNSELGCSVASLASGGVALINDDTIYFVYPPIDSGRTSKNEFIRTAKLVPHGRQRETDPKKYSIVCGASDGSIFVQPVEIVYGEVDQDRPFQKGCYQIKPSHHAAVTALACPTPGLVVSAAQDSIMKVWELGDTDTSKSSSCLYQFAGYKVWIGSLWTDGQRLLSDGADNCVIEHDFSRNLQSEDDDVEVGEFE